jgi:hypothetical protein
MLKADGELLVKVLITVKSATLHLNESDYKKPNLGPRGQLLRLSDKFRKSLELRKCLIYVRRCYLLASI